MKNEDDIDKTTAEKKSAIDPTDPRQAAFVAGGMTGAVAGAAVGSMAGPIGTVIGATVGGFAGAKSAEDISIDLAAENAHWEGSWKQQPYASSAESYSDIAPAYRAGYELPADIYSDSEASFEKSEPLLRQNYEAQSPKLPWGHARPAAKDAFDRVISARKAK